MSRAASAAASGNAASAAAPGNANMSPAELANLHTAQQLQNEVEQNELEQNELKSIRKIISEDRPYLFEKGEKVALKHANGETLEVPVGILLQYLHTTLQTNRLVQQKVYDMIISKNKSKFEHLGREGTGSSNIPKSDDDIFKEIGVLMASPASKMSLPPNTGISTALGFTSGLSAKSPINTEVTSHAELRRELANRLRQTELERGNAIKARISDEAWHKKISDITSTRSVKEQHPTLLELCKPGTIHHCLRTIHHYFGAFMDHGHDWKNITWCVLLDTLRSDTTWLNGIVGSLPTTGPSKDKIRAWIATWTKKVLEIREGNGVSEARCREYLDVLNEEYIRLVKDPAIMGKEPLADWLISSFEDTIVKSWEFTESERPEKMAEMKDYLKSLGIRIVYTESGANWMEFLLERPKKQLKLDEILTSANNKLAGVRVWPHAMYNAASCGVTYCSATAGPCNKECSIPVQIDSMEILGAMIHVVLPSNKTGVNLEGIQTIEDKRALEVQGGILIQKYGHYVILLGDPVELSLNALAKQIDASVGTYRRGDANNSKIIDLNFIFSADIPYVLKAQLITILKTWTDAIQLRGVSAIKKSMNAQDQNRIVVITLDTMCMKSAETEDITYLLFSSVANRKKDSSKHRYTLHCFDNTAMAANVQKTFEEKRKTFAWVCEKVANTELKTMINALMKNKSDQLKVVADAVADPTLFFACHQLRESVEIHRTQAHNRCDEIANLIQRINTSPTDIHTKKAVENAIEMCPDDPSGVLEKFTSLRTLAEKFEDNIKQIQGTNEALHSANTPKLLLQSFTSACQDVRNSGIGKNEQDIELYAVCMMVMEYVIMGHEKAKKILIDIQEKAFDLVKDRILKQHGRFTNFVKDWTVSQGTRGTKPEVILNELHHTKNSVLKDVFADSNFKDIMKATSMCLYILNEMIKPSSELAYKKLNETANANMTTEEKKELQHSGKLSDFNDYSRMLKEQKKTFTLRMVGVSFSRFVQACRKLTDLFCKECPIENKCATCIGSECRVGSSSSSRASSSSTSANIAMIVPKSAAASSNLANAAASSSSANAPMPPLPRKLGPRTSSQAGLLSRNANVNNNSSNNSELNANKNADINGGGTKKHKSQTHKRQKRKNQTHKRQQRKRKTHKRQQRNRKTLKTRKN